MANATHANGILSRLEQIFLWISVAALVLAGGLVLLAVPSRSFPAIAVPDNVLFVQLLLLTSIALGLGHATGKGQHIAVDLLYERFGPTGKKAARFLALAAGLLFFVPLAWWYAGLAWEHFESGRSQYGQLRMPKWPPYAILSLGLWLVSLRLLLFMVQGAPEIEADAAETEA
ncbi:MAG: TRAP transporter small permease [Flavobacteriaceae bacterium]